VARRAGRRLVIVPYRTYGTPRLLNVCGRVLEGLPLPASSPSSRRWRNLLAFRQDLKDGLEHVGVLEVKIRLVAVEPVPVVRSNFGIPGPV